MQSEASKRLNRLPPPSILDREWVQGLPVYVTQVIYFWNPLRASFWQLKLYPSWKNKNKVLSDQNWPFKWAFAVKTWKLPIFMMFCLVWDSKSTWHRMGIWAEFGSQLLWQRSPKNISKTANSSRLRVLQNMHLGLVHIITKNDANSMPHFGDISRRSLSLYPICSVLQSSDRPRQSK